MFIFPFSYMSQTQNLFIKKTGLAILEKKLKMFNYQIMHDDGVTQVT